MESLLNFVLENQNKINNQTKISIKIGHNLGNGIFNTKINKENSKKILDNIKKLNLPYTINTKYYRIYKNLDMEYRISKNEETNHSREILNSETIMIDDVACCLFLEKTIEHDLTCFPNRQEYHDILNTNIFRLYINNLFYLVITINETSQGSYQTLSIELNRENIYKDKIKDNLKKIIEIVVKNYQV